MKLKEIFFFFLEIIQVVAIALIIVLPIRYFIFQPFVVNGASMEPNFHNGDYLIVDELSYRFRDPVRGEVIVFHYPKEPSQRFIKRVVGLPGETISIQNNKIYISDHLGNQLVLNETEYIIDPLWSAKTALKLDKDEYFVLGDNRSHSYDSRGWGALNRDEIVGRVIVRAWPPTAMAMIAAPEY